MAIKKKEILIDLDFEVGKTYLTKFQTKDLFTITKILTRPFLNTTKIIRIEGIYSTAPHLGSCPLPEERLYPEQRIDYEEIEVCDICGKEKYS